MTRRKWLNAALAWVLAAMTAVTSVPLDAYAAEDTPVTQVTAQEEVEGEPDAEDPEEEGQDVSEGENEETDEEENSEQEEESQDQDSQDGEDADENSGEATDATRPEEETTPEEEDRGAMAEGDGGTFAITMDSDYDYNNTIWWTYYGGELHPIMYTPMDWTKEAKFYMEEYDADQNLVMTWEMNADRDDSEQSWNVQGLKYIGTDYIYGHFALQDQTDKIRFRAVETDAENEEVYYSEFLQRPSRLPRSDCKFVVEGIEPAANSAIIDWSVQDYYELSIPYEIKRLDEMNLNINYGPVGGEIKCIYTDVTLQKDKDHFSYKLTDLVPNTAYQMNMRFYINGGDGKPVFEQTISDLTFTTKSNDTYNFAEIIPDPVLRKLISKECGIDTDAEQITSEQLATVKYLSNERKSKSEEAVTSLQGIEYLTNLESISLESHNISTLENVDWSKLQKLKGLGLDGNEIEKATDLTGASKLEHVGLDRNCLSDEEVNNFAKNRPKTWSSFSARNQRIGNDRALVEPVYYQVDGKTPLFVVLKKTKFEETPDVSFTVDGKQAQFSKGKYASEGYGYLLADSGLDVGTHQLVVTLDGTSASYEFTVSDETDYLAPTVLSAVEEYFRIKYQMTSNEKKVTDVRVEDASGKVVADGGGRDEDNISVYEDGSDDRYQGLSNGRSYYVGGIYTIQTYWIDLYPYYNRNMWTKDEKCDVVITYSDGSEKRFAQAVEIRGDKGTGGYVSEISDCGGYRHGYDSTGKYLYIIMRGYEFDPSRLVYQIKTADGVKELKYVSHKKIDEGGGCYVVKLQRDGLNCSMEEADYDGVQLMIQPQEGYEVRIPEKEVHIRVYSELYYHELNGVDGIMEVGITPDKKPRRVDVVVKKRNGYQGKEEKDFASGMTEDITDGFARISLKDSNGNVINEDYNGYAHIYIYVDGKLLYSESEQIRCYRTDARTIGMWSGEDTVVSGTEAATYFCYTELPYEEYRGREQDVRVDLVNRQGDIVQSAQAECLEEEGCLKICNTIDFSEIEEGEYTLRAICAGEVLSTYDIHVLANDKFVINGSAGYYAEWEDGSKETLRFSIKTPNSTEEDDFALEMWDPYGNKVDNIVVETKKSYGYAEFRIKGLDPKTAYRQYWFKVTHKTLGEACKEDGTPFYTNEKGKQVRISSTCVVHYHQRAPLYELGLKEFTFPVTLRAFYPNDTEILSEMRATEGDKDGFVCFTQEFISALPDITRLYDVQVIDAEGNSRVVDRARLGFKQTQTVALKGIKLNQTTMTLQAGESGQLTVSYQPANATEKPKAVWSSSNENIATVDQATGKVTAVAYGTAKITAKCGKYTAACTVNVCEQVKAPQASPDAGLVEKGQEIVLTTETAGASIRYTTDGTDPSEQGAKPLTYKNPICIGKDMTIRAYAVKKGYADSEVKDFTYQIGKCTVTFDTAGGSPDTPAQTVEKGGYLDMQMVNTPEKENYRFAGWYAGEVKLDPLQPVTEDMTVEAHWTEAEKLAKPTANYADGKTLLDGAKVLLTVEGAESRSAVTIYYTTDGNEPTKESAVYQDGIVLKKAEDADENVTVKAVAMGSGYVQSDVAVYEYVLQKENQTFGTIEAEDIPAGEVPEGLWAAGLEDSYTFTGKAVKPQIRVYDGNVKLTEKKDYKLTYGKNVKPGTGAGSIVIAGVNNYSGKKTVKFDIAPKSLLDSDVQIEDIMVLENGKVNQAKPVVKCAGKALKQNKDYKVTYGKGDFKQPGKYEITIDGMGNYAGSCTIVETILSKKTEMLLGKAKIGSIKAQTYTGEEIRPVVQIKDGKTELKEGQDYTVEYRNNVAVGTAVILVKGIGNYHGTRQVNFKINGISMSKVSVADGWKKEIIYQPGKSEYIQENLKLTYQKSRKDPVIELRADDYTISYQNNTKAGTASAILTGNPERGYFGVKKLTFKISPCKDLANAQMSFDKSVAYAKGGCMPDVEVTLAGVTLVKGTDYKVAYKNNKAVAGKDAVKKPTITVTGVGNYKGTLSGTFEITPQELGNLKMQAKDKVAGTKKNSYATAVTITDLDGKNLQAGKDYEKLLTYQCGDTVLNKDMEPSTYPAGTVIKVTAVGKGAYTGEISATYRMVAVSIEKAKVTLNGSFNYEGKELQIAQDQLKIELKVGRETRTLNAQDYEIIGYKNNLTKGTATVILHGLGEYGGTKNVTFKIGARPIG